MIFQAKILVAKTLKFVNEIETLIVVFGAPKLVLEFMKLTPRKMEPGLFVLLNLTKRKLHFKQKCCLIYFIDHSCRAAVFYKQMTANLCIFTALQKTALSLSLSLSLKSCFHFWLESSRYFSSSMVLPQLMN